jgi:hypothetical protein
LTQVQLYEVTWSLFGGVEGGGGVVEGVSGVKGVGSGVEGGSDIIEGGGGGVEEPAALREEAAPRLGSLTVQNEISPRLGFRVGEVTPLIPGTFLILAKLCQSIPIMRFMVSADVI